MTEDQNLALNGIEKDTAAHDLYERYRVGQLSLDLVLLLARL